jgi:phosphoribosyl 1,2-cyclic phosphodiesterase
VKGRFRFRVLGSVSTGNATLVEAGRTRVLIDAGLGPRILAERLQDAGVDPASLDLVLLSHEHNDHAKGAVAFAKKWGPRIACSAGTARALGLAAEAIPGWDPLAPGAALCVGEVVIDAVALPHDAAQPLAFVVRHAGRAFGHATDFGHWTRPLVDAFRGCDGLLVESNYDPGMLKAGPYPWSLKERILSPRGHVSNADVGRFLADGLGERCRSVVLAHLSQQNNHPELAWQVAETALARRGRSEVELHVLTADGGGAWHAVAEPEPAPSRPHEQLRLF